MRFGIACLAALFASDVSAANEAKPRNVVFIMADDVGLGDIGYYHRQRTGEQPIVETPHLDALAVAGKRFSDAHSSTALCSPSRYCAMSGNLCHRSYAPWGVWGSFRPTPFKSGDATLGRVAKRAGMATGFFGKWHLGGDFARASDPSKTYRGNDRGDEPLDVDVSRILGAGPKSVGFDESCTLPCGIQGPLYVAYRNGEWEPFSPDSELIHYTADTAISPKFVSDKGPGMGDSHWDPRRAGPMLSKRAVKFIAKNAKENQPFFLCYWSPMVHVPHEPPREFDGRKVRGETPTRHLDMLIDLDQQVGRIVGALKKAGQYEQTLIVFSSDNGGLRDGRGQKAGHDSSGGFRGFKNDPYEGGHRVPFFATWPEVISTDSESEEPVAVHDLVATMASLLDQPLEEHQAMDSLDLAPLLFGKTLPKAREDFLLQGGSRHELIYRQGDWKLIVQSDHKVTKFEPIALFDLAANPLEEESSNLIDDPEQADRAASMFKRYTELRESGARTAPR